jgi:hypothetical protein
MKKHMASQVLSPEKYILTRARTLPIGPCYVNDDWKLTGIARITVTRMHINGNVTFGNYLVDLYCLGVFDSHWTFNIPGPEFREYIDDQNTTQGIGYKLTITEYVLVHNIIYGAVEFASDFGFHPHKSFEVASRLLEEDDECIPLTDVEFGFKGKPLYLSNVKNPYEKNRVISQLEKCCGSGNYYTVDDREAAAFFIKEAKADGNIPDYQNPKVKQDLIGDFLKHTKNLQKTLNTKSDSFSEICERSVEIFYEYMVNDEEQFKASETIRSLYDFTISKEVFSDEMLFGSSRKPENRSEIRKAAEEAWRQMGREAEDEAASNNIKRLIQKYPGIPIFRYLDFRLREFKSGMKGLLNDLEQYVIQHPDYLPVVYLFTISWLMNRPDKAERKMGESIHLKVAGKGRSSFCLAEAAVYTEALSTNYIVNQEFILLQEQNTYLEFNMPALAPDRLIFMTKLAQVINVRDWCENWMKNQSE